MIEWYQSANWDIIPRDGAIPPSGQSGTLLWNSHHRNLNQGPSHQNHRSWMVWTDFGDSKVTESVIFFAGQARNVAIWQH
jgi:hypothetical protein